MAGTTLGSLLALTSGDPELEGRVGGNENESSADSSTNIVGYYFSLEAPDQLAAAITTFVADDDH